MTDKQRRDEVLDELEVATKQWRDKHRRRLEDQVKLAQNILKGRNGPQRLQDETTKQASALLVDEIEAFLTGSE
jgi:hypothetical protein